jgi:hypothetical protein
MEEICKYLTSRNVLNLVSYFTNLNKYIIIWPNQFADTGLEAISIHS